MKFTHTYRASLNEKGGIVVVDKEGNPVEVTYGATLNMKTCTAHVRGVGFIGGWQAPRRKGMRFQWLVPSINKGILYTDMNDLPKHGYSI